MRSARTGLWLTAFLLGASLPAFCQVIVPPNISGHTIPSDIITGQFQQPVYSTGTFEATLLITKNYQIMFYGSVLVGTNGPITNVGFNIAFNRFGLVAGDSITFVFSVKHRATEGGTTSVTVSVIPVVPPTSTPPPTSKLWSSPGGASRLAAARKEEMSV
jgi:hypothetical protein